jgi:oligopeptidase A
MVKTGQVAQDFVTELQGHAAAVAAEEHSALQGFREGLEGSNSPTIQAWDLAYYAEKQRLAEYDFDSEALRPYLSVDRVFEGLFELLNRLYGIEIVEIDDLPTWHPSVRTFALEEDGARTGLFYVDLFPRVGKRGGAWMYPLSIGDPAAGIPHVGVVCGNMTPPSENGPALLRHREVETLFHEFGHLMHHLLTRVEVQSLAGTSVAWDFVELPSQIMENWCWERAALDIFARHHETDAPIPEALFEKMTRARTFRGGYQTMRQLGFAAVDLALHRDYDPTTDGDVLPYARAVASTFQPTPMLDDYAMITGFLHLFSSPVGYAAGYYSYKWAEVLEADAFSRFAEEGLFSREVGQAFRETILERGDSRDPMELFVDFMGREPDQKALLVRSGLVR